MTTAVGESRSVLRVDGMDCASCVASVERAAGRIPGVRGIQVNLARGRAIVRLDPALTTETTVAAAISAIGYPSQPEAAAGSEDDRIRRQEQETRAWLFRAVIGLSLWLPGEILHWTAGAHAHWVNWVGLVLSTVAILYGAKGFYVSAFKSLRAGSANMDVLIAMGFTTAYAYSVIALLGSQLGWWAIPQHLYFMESAALLGLISLGHYLEARARRSAGAAIRSLLELAPATALRISRAGDKPSPLPTSSRKVSLAVLGNAAPPAAPPTAPPAALPSNSNEPQEVQVADLEVGDRVLIRPGDKVPTDAKVIEGRSAVDESMLTGESVPALRQVGDEITGGTVNGDGRLIAQVTRIGSETALAQIVRLVEDAQASKPPVQKLADRIAAIFVPAVLAIALLTGIGWLAWGTLHTWPASQTWGMIANAVCSVLLIACPCALGLAVPAALMVGTGRGARRGILVRDIDALQSAERLTTVVLDKTGTLTQGKPSVVEIVTVGGMPEALLLRLAAAAESGSEHPLARAIVAEARQRGIEVGSPEHFQSEPGLGVVAEVGGQTLLVGGRALLEARGVAIADLQGEEDASEVWVATDGVVSGVIRLRDEVRPDSAQAVRTLQAMGLEVVLLTGDREPAARRAAAAVGITRVMANIRPQGKAEAVAGLQAEGPGNFVAMVGDGVNDAPALAAADLGVAIGSGSDVAKETGDLVLVGSSLAALPAAIALSRATMRTIRQNLFFAFIYNVLAIPFAAFGYLTPLIAAAGMAFSDVTVIGNALRLRRARIDRDLPGHQP